MLLESVELWIRGVGVELKESRFAGPEVWPEFIGLEFESRVV